MRPVGTSEKGRTMMLSWNPATGLTSVLAAFGVLLRRAGLTGLVIAPARPVADCGRCGASRRPAS